MAFSFKSAERERRYEPSATLHRRDDSALPFVGPHGASGGSLLLDTCVYIDQIQDKAPPIVEELLLVRLVHHSSIAVQEMLHTVGVLKPDDPRSRRSIAAIGEAIGAMPAHRVFVPDLDTLARGAVLAGILCRLQGYVRDDRMRALHDCVLFLQAMKLGMTVLTRNVSDFDYLLQVRPSGRVLFYRA